MGPLRFKVFMTVPMKIKADRFSLLLIFVTRYIRLRTPVISSYDNDEFYPLNYSIRMEYK